MLDIIVSVTFLVGSIAISPSFYLVALFDSCCIYDFSSLSDPDTHHGIDCHAFFEGVNQMEIPHGTVLQLQTEGIMSVADLTDFDTSILQQLADNLQQTRGRVPNLNQAAAPGMTISIVY